MSGVGCDSYNLPKWRLTSWFADVGDDVPAEIRRALIANLYGSLPVFLGGVFNTIAVSAILAFRMERATFWFWLAIEVALCLSRLTLILDARRFGGHRLAIRTDLVILLALGWASSVGFGTIISMLSGDWIAATLACLSAAAMVGGICLRNYSAPRLAGAMIFLGLGPAALGALLSGEATLLIVGVQIPFYLYAMSAASYQLNRMLVSTMIAERENDRQARHDSLTGLLNRNGLERAMGEVEEGTKVLFYLDLDGFKDVNDRFGHAAGDRLLTYVADRLRAATPRGDALARIGGDEFVLLSLVANQGAALLTAERIVLAVAGAAYDLGAERVHVGVSVGIALQPDHGSSLGTLLDAADAALYRAKASGKCRYVIADRTAPVHAPNWAGTARARAFG